MQGSENRMPAARTVVVAGGCAIGDFPPWPATATVSRIRMYPDQGAVDHEREHRIDLFDYNPTVDVEQ